MQGGGWSTIISYGVEISIAGGVVEMVRVLSRCSEIPSPISWQQDPVSQRAATYKVLQTECSQLLFLVRGPKFPGDGWRPMVPMSGLEGGVAVTLLEVRTLKVG